MIQTYPQVCLANWHIILRLDHSSYGNGQDRARLREDVLLRMQRSFWHTLDAVVDFFPTVLQSSHVNAFELETLLIAVSNDY